MQNKIVEKMAEFEEEYRLSRRGKLWLLFAGKQRVGMPPEIWKDDSLELDDNMLTTAKGDMYEICNADGKFSLIPVPIASIESPLGISKSSADNKATQQDTLVTSKFGALTEEQTLTQDQVTIKTNVKGNSADTVKSNVLYQRDSATEDSDNGKYSTKSVAKDFQSMEIHRPSSSEKTDNARRGNLNIFYEGDSLTSSKENLVRIEEDKDISKTDADFKSRDSACDNSSSGRAVDVLESEVSVKCDMVKVPLAGDDLDTGSHGEVSARRPLDGLDRAAYQDVHGVDDIAYNDEEETASAKLLTGFQSAMNSSSEFMSREVCIGTVKLYTQLGQMTELPGDCIVYLWSRKQLHEVEMMDHPILSQVDDVIRQQWAKHRASKDKYRTFSTSGGKLGIPLIVHVPCKDNPSGLERGFTEGLMWADQQQKKSLVIPFNVDHPFLCHKERLASSLLSAVTQLPAPLVHVNDISIIVEEESGVFPRLSEPFNSYKGSTHDHHSDEGDSDKDFEKVSEPDSESEHHSELFSQPFSSMVPSHIRASPNVTANQPVSSDGASLKKVGKKWILMVDGKCVMLPEDIANYEKQLKLVGGCISSDDNVYEVRKVANGKVEIVPVDEENVTPKTLQAKAEKEIALFQSKSGKEINSGMDDQKKDGQKESKTSDGIGIPMLRKAEESMHQTDVSPTDIDRAEAKICSEKINDAKENIGPKWVKLPSMSHMLASDGKTCDQFLEKVDRNQMRDESFAAKDLIKTPDESGQTSFQAMQSQLGMLSHVQPRKLSVDFEWSKDAKHVKSYKTPEGIQVYVYVADILRLPVDCIVNAANDILQHGGGVSKMIARAAGYELNRESAEYIRNKGNVPVGRACCTTAGKLHYDCVVHAVGPRWSDYSPHRLEDVKSCQTHLHSAVYQSFLQAEKRKLKSIALPAISSAIFGVPFEMCVYNYARATLDYSRKAQQDTGLTEIHFIDVKKAIVKEIQDMFDVMIDQGREPDYNIEKFAQQSISSQRCTNSTNDDDGFTCTESFTITEDDWDILRTLEHDKITKIESGGKITFDYDTLFVQYDVGNSKLKGIVEELKSTSLKLKDKQIEQIPLDHYREAKRWCKEIGETLLTNCCVFVQDKNCVLAFCDTYEEVQKVKHQFKIKEGKVKITSRTGRGFQVSKEDLMNTADESGPTSLQAMQSQLGMPRHVQPRTLSVDFEWSRDAKHVKSYKTPEGIQVYVYVADILRLPVDCIVNAANDILQHGGGVSKVIARAAGYELNRESAEYIRNKGNVPVGQACYTTAGKLHYDCVVHAVGPRWSDYSPHRLEDVKSCQIDLHSAVYESFIQAEKRKLKSIALPAISSAIFGVPVEICVYNYARATLDYSRKVQQDAALKEIHFIDAKKAIVKEIQDMFDVMIDQGREPDYNIERFAQQPTSSQWNRSPYDNRGAYSGRNKNQSPPNQNRRSSGNVASPIQSPRMSSGSGASPVQSPSVTGGSPGFQTSVRKYGDRDKQVYVFGDQQNVTVYKGDIFRAEAQAIVSVEDLSCNGSGRIAKELTKRAKNPGYTTGKNLKFSQRPRNIGDVFVTDGFHSGFRKILHAILPYEITARRNEERKQLIAKAYKNVFVTAHIERIDNVALALIGVGANKPEDVRLSTKAFLESFTEFCDSGKQLSILLVCYNEEKMTQVCQVFDQNADQSGFGASSGSPPPRPPPLERHGARTGGPPLMGYNTRSRYPPPMGYNTGSGDQDGRGPEEPMDTSPSMGRSVYRRAEDMEVCMEDGGLPGIIHSSQLQNTTDDNCVICMDKITEPKQLLCGHVFCTECIDQSFKHKEQCPTCGKVCGIITGTQPEGTMNVHTKKWDKCKGYEDSGRIDITYTFFDGVQGPEHPTPGERYKGFVRIAYLPDNDQGRKICKMLKVAFKRKLVFTIGNSTTTGKTGVITWNDIHHKTNPSPHSQLGYPDPGYFDRVTEELAAKGVTEKDIQ